ncbi:MULTISPECIES: alanine racemase [unclassified Microbacterium]|uniref:alanine racemase n=1 Tax=unclassified Microbacterium TaxID=2609290 RepID=UPI000CFA9AE1|nr:MULTISPECIES: alanine racemase [unclassified Microbacterium]PQZ57424.1 alanine racemase [Microbacterium sp. MYb43]PQZ75749.1 alanine racemase [Microbacterium sp. MYb40]PRB22779.1 alanine racemase [Microbacterium sp. MYb54]PRB28879.1 alanine racemase [Microbacterium sp. MYb50]PRB69045.1 alanine racemase [Microbacterium sp. MYb24]
MLDLIDELSPVHGAPSVAPEWEDPARYWPRLSAVTGHLPAPVAVIDREALRYNAMDLLVRAGGLPIRVASKSVRVRAVLDAVLKLPGFHGILAFTLEEALWLAETHDDIMLGYPTVDRAGLERLFADEQAAQRITLMVDDLVHLDLIDSVAGPGSRPELRVAIDVDASWRSSLLGHIGVRRSALFSAGEVAAFARKVVARPGFQLVGLQMYDAQIAGQGDDAGPDAPLIRMVQARSRNELRERRAAIVAAVGAIAPLEILNGGGTGSLEFTGSDESLTEASAGSGLLGGHLFDGYRSFRPAPASAFAFDVVRRPATDIATVLGGGWIASGPALASRQPRAVWPEGLHTLSREAAGEVQTPLQGPAATSLGVGDRVWFRHAKSGEPAERIESYHLVSGDEIIDELPTYRGEGKAFL